MRSRRRTNAVQVRVSGNELPPRARAVEHVLRSLYTSAGGPRTAVVAERRRRFGPNLRPLGRPPSLAVVAGTHARSGVGHALLGSVAEWLIRAAPCDVAVTRPARFTFVMP